MERVRAGATKGGAQAYVLILGAVNLETWDGTEHDWDKESTGWVGLLLRTSIAWVEVCGFFE
jgi:hypothetical protein